MSLFVALYAHPSLSVSVFLCLSLSLYRPLFCTYFNRVAPHTWLYIYLCVGHSHPNTHAHTHTLSVFVCFSPDSVCLSLLFFLNVCPSLLVSVFFWSDRLCLSVFVSVSFSLSPCLCLSLFMCIPLFLSLSFCVCLSLSLYRPLFCTVIMKSCGTTHMAVHLPLRGTFTPKHTHAHTYIYTHILYLCLFFS